MAMTPAVRPPSATATTVFPSPSRAGIFSSTSPRRATPLSARKSLFPAAASSPSIRAVTPLPANVSGSAPSGTVNPPVPGGIADCRSKRVLRILLDGCGNAGSAASSPSAERCPSLPACR